MDYEPPCGPGVGTVHGHDVGEGREGQCRRRLMMRCGGAQCADVKDHDPGTAAVGATGSTPSRNHRSTGQGCVLAVAGTRTQKLDMGSSGIQHCPHTFMQRPSASCVLRQVPAEFKRLETGVLARQTSHRISRILMRATLRLRSAICKRAASTATKTRPDSSGHSPAVSPFQRSRRRLR
ncbi:hypothetical protein OH76DRAFT_1184142 [Lentinus brumalis]|uniref:Uncharacterized protein n=1 Tax=Lentinus brumalis TaxID=2498619 RepID=A0A371CU11_9APHY|nr:hypothetical protein OH76DRAFT_1184142 [Polyporus brumalis]